MSHALTLIVTRDVEPRYRGFLRSVMIEITACIYVSPQLNRDARDRVWDVLTHWHETLHRGSIIMIWRDKGASGNIGFRVLGDMPKQFCDADGFLLTRLPK